MTNSHPSDSAPWDERPQPAKIVHDFPHRVREVEHAWITLADGTRLATRYWLPEDADENPVPAILEYIPYCKRDGTAARDEVMHPYFAGHGYVAIRVDMRGAGESDGLLHDEYLKQEQDDAVEVIAWIAARPWCDGRVGMMGKSWGGFNGLQVAARRPPALRCIISVFSTADRYADDIHYMGGCMLAENPIWAFTMFGMNARPPDPLLVGDGWRETWRERLEHNRPWVIDWMRHQRRDAFWKHGSVCEAFDDIQCPVYAIGGWADPYSNTVPRLLAGLSVPAKGLVGPWGHQYPHQAHPGPSAGFLQDALRWWDHWLKDDDNGVMDEPAYRVWMQDSVPPRTGYGTRPGQWVAEPAWPSPNIENRRMALNADGLSPTAGPERPLTVSCPQNVGECSVIWGNNGDGAPECPSDQRADDARSLCFDSAPLDDALSILGAPAVELDLSSDQPSALVAVRLCEVLADGASTQITYGVLNLTHRDDHEEISPLEPGRRYRVRIQCNDIAHVFAVGSRIRVAVATGHWPILWPSPKPVTLMVHAGVSGIDLPIRAPRPEDSDIADLPPPEKSARQPRTVLRVPEETVMRLERDIIDDRVTFVHEEDSGKVRIDSHGWEFGGKATRRMSVRPSDPNSARIELHGVREYGREGGPQIWIETTNTVTSDETDFHLHATLEVREDGRPVFSRSWLESIPRDGV